MSRNDGGSSGESFQFAPRIAAVPERLRRIWWVKRLPQFIALMALVAAVILPLLSDKSERHQTWAAIIAFALCAISVVVLTGWGGQLSLGQMAFAGLGALTAAALIRGLQFNIGWKSTRFLDGGIGGIPFLWAMLLGACFASLVAVVVGVGALRVRGLLLAISTLAFAIAAQAYLFNRTFFTAGSTTVQIPRTDVLFLELTHRNRAYYYFCLFMLMVVLVLVGHLKRTGIGRMIVGVRENELAASAMTVSPAREAHLLRARRLHRRARRCAPRRGEPHVRPFRRQQLLPGRELDPTRRHRRDRRPGQPQWRRGGRPVGDRLAVVLARQRARPALHVEHRAADHPALHPRRFRADRLLRA